MFFPQTDEDILLGDSYLRRGFGRIVGGEVFRNDTVEEVCDLGEESRDPEGVLFQRKNLLELVQDQQRNHFLATDTEGVPMEVFPEFLLMFTPMRDQFRRHPSLGMQFLFQGTDYLDGIGGNGLLRVGGMLKPDTDGKHSCLPRLRIYTCFQNGRFTDAGAAIQYRLDVVFDAAHEFVHLIVASKEPVGFLIGIKPFPGILVSIHLQ